MYSAISVTFTPRQFREQNLLVGAFLSKKLPIRTPKPTFNMVADCETFAIVLCNIPTKSLDCNKVDTMLASVKWRAKGNFYANGPHY